LAVPRIKEQARPDAHIGISLNLTHAAADDDSAAARQGVERADPLNNRWFLDPLFHGHYPDRLFADLAVTPPAIESQDMALISASMDFLGISYYARTLFRDRSRLSLRTAGAEPYEQVVPVPGASYTEMAWEI
jgi:beta-glucosidase